MPPHGYAPLMDVGAMPVFLRPWDDQLQVDAARKYAEQWEKFSEKPIEIDPETFHESDMFYTAVGQAARGMNAFDTTLHTMSYYLDDIGNESEQMAVYLRTVLPNADDMMEQLSSMAAMQLDDGYITHKKLLALAMERELANLETPQPSANDVPIAESMTESEPEIASNDEDYDRFFSHLDSEESTVTPTEPETNVPDKVEGASGLADTAEEALNDDEKAIAVQQRQISHEQSTLLKTLVEAGLLVQYRGGRYQFRHAFTTAYLAACFVEDADEFTLLNKQANPDWEHAICYLAQMRDIDGLVAQQLSHNDMDVLYENILTLTRWLRFAGTDVKWRNNLFRYLGNLMVAANQFTLVRERIAAALLGMRDDGALVIFRKSMGHPNPEIRKLGCLGVGVLQDEAAIDPLVTHALQDDNLDVQTAAALALSAIGTQEALIALTEVFEESEVRQVQRAIAESLAANREEGYLTLFEAVKSKEMMVRRSTVFGLGRVRADWALITLNDIFLEDNEFYVRLAAENVFSDIYAASLKGIHIYPDIEEAPWLHQWIQEQIEAGILSYDTPPNTFLDVAFTHEEDPFIRALAIATIGQLGLTNKIGGLYVGLSDRSEIIRDESYRALGEFQQRFGKPFPAPIA
ncbi:MAG: HEAT repeat domain-containing protein [Anaerolineae bacterium]|nr:HEAT repeat domain-containing protein [Anaerolineae bacterium]